MYFVNEHHAVNYKLTLIQWPSAASDLEYAAACYILAVPMIFEKIVDELDNHESPIDWILNWEDKSIEKPVYQLHISMIQLGRLALHLWNGCEPFNLLECLHSLQGHHYEVAKTAMDIRMGRAG